MEQSPSGFSERSTTAGAMSNCRFCGKAATRALNWECGTALTQCFAHQKQPAPGCAVRCSRAAASLTAGRPAPHINSDCSAVFNTSGSRAARWM